MLEGQLVAGKIAMAHLSSPNLYYVLSGLDFTLDINNPEAPKIFCIGNNPMKLQTYGEVISLYVNRLLKVINQKEKEPCGVICDEFPSLVADVIPTITQGRSQKIFVCLGIQDLSQLPKEYGQRCGGCDHQYDRQYYFRAGTGRFSKVDVGPDRAHYAGSSEPFD
ncbi:TraM-binding TraD/TraG-like protein [Anseongella ginsenosidimutans]|uniref:TraM-binding TraD/TraG-like protein n=1 Tax=Anseongella ginsenosidimutans TaxID=496056 RepID=A0A4R3KL74_9SPHI|nr:type IV secretory system conjugative DNA transfer family protein [Anseongella ginsenosidimutans]TCS84758.1 TraM-binding TraD/TraG-like protein [Anseongella ginsenosidimutans]